MKRCERDLCKDKIILPKKKKDFQKDFSMKFCGQMRKQKRKK